jgi:N-acetylmuramoyl-L-alanine amidase
MFHLPRRRLLCCFFLPIFPLLAQESSESRHVTAVRFWTLGDVTRIAIETDGDFRVHSDHLQNPDRLFFDLIGTRPTLGPKGMTVIPVSDRLVRQIRVAETQHNVTRVVLDMQATAEATTSRLDNPDRLIIEVRVPEPTVLAKPPAKPPVEAEVVQTPVVPAAPPKPEPRTFAPPAPRTANEIAQKPVPPVVPLDSPPLISAQSAAPSPAANIASKPSPGEYRPPATVALAKVTVSPPPTLTTPSPSQTALPARRNSSGDRSMIRVLGLKVGRIVLDPGHGGHDTGTIGPEGLREKDLVLDVAKRLGALIEERLGSEVIFTRADDTFIALERRTEIANQAKADLFLSIHANSSTLASAAGVETYYLNFTTSKAALELAARENSGSQKTIFELQDLLQKIALKDKVEESHEFASRIQGALYSFSAKSDAHARDRGVRKAPFVVLIGASMPSVLSEIGFISNAHDESIMKRGEYRQRLAEALFKGLSSYASTLSHFQVAQRHTASP